MASGMSKFRAFRCYSSYALVVMLTGVVITQLNKQKVLDQYRMVRINKDEHFIEIRLTD
jgi:hypothetical protein